MSVNDTDIHRNLPVLQPFLQGHVQRFVVLHLDCSALFVRQMRPYYTHGWRGRLVTPGLAVFPGMVDLVEQLLFFGFELVQLDGKLAILSQVDGRRMVESRERAVQSLDVTLGQAHHFPHVLQFVAQRVDFLEIERHDGAADRFAGPGRRTGRIAGPRGSEELR